MIATFTGYNKFLSSGLIADLDLVKHGYAYINVDMRGTGASEATGRPLASRSGRYGRAGDLHQVSALGNGRIGMNGPYMGITGLLTGAQEDPAVQAIFAVPMGDAYQDIVFSGG